MGGNLIKSWDLRHAVRLPNIQAVHNKIVGRERLLLDLEVADSWQITMIKADGDRNKEVSVCASGVIDVSEIRPVVMASDFKHDLRLVLFEQI